MNIKVTIVGCESGDWEALYINGKLIEESHKIRAYDVLNALSVEHDCIKIPDKVAEAGMPNDLSELESKSTV